MALLSENTRPYCFSATHIFPTLHFVGFHSHQACHSRRESATSHQAIQGFVDFLGKAIGKNNIILDDAHGFSFKSLSNVANSLPGMTNQQEPGKEEVGGS